LARRTPLVGFAGRDWAVFAAMAAGPMLVGHTGMNYALRHFRATTVNVAALGEPVGATVLAWLIPAIHEAPRAMALAGGVLVLLGITLSLQRETGSDPGGVGGGRVAMRVEQLRGGVVEAVHDVHVAVVDSTGGIVARAGDPELVTFWRSAAKPFQALPLVEDGAAERFGLTSQDLALACASHSSEPGQVA